MMQSEYEKYIEELHSRNYSIFNDKDSESYALQELHERSYSIFDEEGTEQLKKDYRIEFSNLPHDISFISLQDKAKKEVTFEEKPKLTQPKSSVPSYSNLLQSLPRVSEDEKFKIDIANIVESLLSSEKQRERDIVNIVESVMLYAIRKAQATPKEIEYEHIFYIKKHSDPTRYCDASGVFDEKSLRFTIKEGSILSFKSIPSLKNTTRESARDLFLLRNCIRDTKGYKLKRDVVFASPDDAASMVTGCISNGWMLWHDINNNTLEKIYIY